MQEEQSKTGHLIWWLSQQDMEAIGTSALPDGSYIQSEFLSLMGRSGRGRLWVSPTLQDVPSSTEVRDNAITRWIEASKAGGIVIRYRDKPLLNGFPGLITTFSYLRA